MQKCTINALKLFLSQKKLYAYNLYVKISLKLQKSDPAWFFKTT